MARMLYLSVLVTACSMTCASEVHSSTSIASVRATASPVSAPGQRNATHTTYPNVTKLSPYRNVTVLEGNTTVTNTTLSPMQELLKKMMTLPEYKLYYKIENTRWFVMAPLGIIGNVLCFSVLVRHARRQSSHVLMTAISVADFSFVVVICATQYLTKYTDVKATGCKILSILNDLVSLISVYFLLAVTAERVLVVWFPFKQKDWCTPKKALIACIVIVLVFSGLSSHWWETATVSYMYSEFQTSGCTLHPKYNHVAPTLGPLFFIVYSVLPFFAMVILNSVLIYGMVQMSRRRAKMMVGRTNTRIIRICVMAVTLSVAHLILTGPYTVFWILLRTNYIDPFSSPEYAAKYFLIRQILLVLMITNHVINFLLYFVSGKSFRDDFIKMFKCTCKGSGRGAAGSRTMTSKLSSSDSRKSEEKRDSYKLEKRSDSYKPENDEPSTVEAEKNTKI